MKRTATTLIEVLIAIFIMALGLVSLLTLFPLGASQMARSIQDDRAAQLAANSTAYFRWYWKDLCEKITPSTIGGQMMYQNVNGTQPQWFTTAMDDPNAGLPTNMMKTEPAIFPATPTTPQILANNVLSQANKIRSSYPVMIDPIGWEAAKGTINQFWLAANVPSAMTNKYAIPRRTMIGMSGFKAQAMRNFMLLDDMGFTDNGSANASERVGQYTCSLMLKREQNAKRTDVSLTVIVYFRRSTETSSEEPAYVGSGTGNVLTIFYNNGEKPAVRKGGWILDATMELVPNNTDPNRYVDCHARYYRVSDVLEDNGASVVVQLERNLKPTANQVTQRLIIIQDRILEVFEKGPIDMNSPTRVN